MRSFWSKRVEDMDSINQNIFLEINRYANQNEILDSLMIGAAEAMPYIFIGLLLYLWFTNRKNEALYAGYAATLGVAINQIINAFYFHARPFMDGIGKTLIQHKAENSFPSDHTTFVISIALMLMTFKSTRKIGIIATLLALWCGVARVYLGVHYPFDILGAIAVASTSVYIVTLSKNRLQKINDYIISIWNKMIRKP